MNQITELLAWLKKGHRITQMQATDMFGITRLGAKVFELKKAGYDIQDNWISTINRYGHKTRFKEYYLVEKEK